LIDFSMNKKAKSPHARAFLVVCGFIAVGLGIVGIILPLLPTTPFLLLASFCFIRSSDRFYHWLLNNRLLGTYIRDYVEKKAIKRNVKWATLVILWGTILLSISMVGFTLWRTLLLLTIAIGVTVHIVLLRNTYDK